VAIAAFVVSVIAVGIALASVVYTRRADQRADRAEARALRADDRAAAEARASELERIGAIVREIADAARAAATDPMASSRLHATRARLEAAIEVSGIELTRCSIYATTVSQGDLEEAERELEREIANARRDLAHQPSTSPA
jgi:hypothetical protein